jgi:ribulose-phosphate 3-epimerase
VDMVVLVAVNPGVAGQKYIASTGARLGQARTLAGSRDLLFCVDGGVTGQNIAAIAALRPDIVVAGSAVFTGDPAENVKAFQAMLRGKAAVA